MMKQLVVFGTAVMTTLLALLALWQFRSAIVYVLASLALAATARPLIMDWKRRRLVMRLALALLYILSLCGFGFMIFHVGKFAVGDVQQIAQTLSLQGAWVVPPWLEGSSFHHVLVTWLPTPDKLFEAVTELLKKT